MFNKAKKWARLAGLSILYGMKGADDLISSQVDPKNKSTINQSQSRGGVLQEMLEEEQTQRVQEVRDEYYRILRAAENIHVDVDPSFMKEDWNEDVDGNKLYATARKKTVSDFVQHVKVYNSDNLPIKVIQDNIKIDSKSAWSTDGKDLIESFHDSIGTTDDFSYLTLLDVHRDTVPSFKIEKLVKKIVVKTVDDSHSIVELYLPAEPPQFSPIGSTLTNRMKSILEKNNLRDPLLDANGFEFITEKPWTDKGCHSGEKFSYKNAKPIGIVVFDGNIIIQYNCENITEYEYVGDKFKTASVDEKYENIQLREGAIPTIGAIQRRDEYLNEKTKQENEDSN